VTSPGWQGSPPRVGFVGLGNQGAPIAQRIAASGLPLTVWARRPEALQDFPTARHAVDLIALAKDSDLVGVCVLDDAATEEVVSGMFPGLVPGTIVVIHATVHPQTCVRLGQRLEAAGCHLLDAPVSGGPFLAQEGRLTVMCGGADAVLARCRPVLETFAGLIVPLGDVGAGQKAKLINNALMTADMALAHAAKGIAETIGVDVAGLHRVVAASSGRSFGYDAYAQWAAPGQFGRGVRLLGKDLGILRDVIAGAGGQEGLLVETADMFFEIDAPTDLKGKA